MPTQSSGDLAIHDVCILRLSALGDVCNLVPSVRALQQAQPDIKITWIIGRAEYNLLAGLEGVTFRIYDKKTGLAGMQALRRQLLEERKGRPFEVLLHMQAALRASVLSRFIPAKRRIGFDKARAKDWQGLFVNERIAPNPESKVCTGFMDFVTHLGVKTGEPVWDIPVEQEAQEKARTMTQGFFPYLLISPCASARKRNWRNWENYQGFAQIAEYAFRKYGLHTILVGGNTTAEQHATTEICQQANTPVLDLRGKTTLKELLALIRGSTMVIAPDSGPIHMAVAMGRPALGLYATTNPHRGGPWFDEFVVNRYPEAVKKYLHQDLNQLSWGQRVRHREAMSVIEISDVINQVNAVMAKTGKTGNQQ